MSASQEGAAACISRLSRFRIHNPAIVAAGNIGLLISLLDSSNPTTTRAAAAAALANLAENSLAGRSAIAAAEGGRCVPSVLWK